MVTIRDIARQLGVSPSAVSLALKGTGRVSPAKRTMIRAAAKAMGYQPHPLVSKAFSLVRQPDALRYRETIAFLLEWPLQPGSGGSRELFEPALERALSLGYNLEPIVVSNEPAEHRRLTRILRARGIRGVIIYERLGTLRPRLHLDWNHFAAVEMNRTLWSPRNLHRVEVATFSPMFEALHLLKKVGYRRVGMAVEPDQNKQARGLFYSTYLYSQLARPEGMRIPVLALEGPWGEETFRAWMRQYRPDVLYVHDFRNILTWLKRLHLRVPGDVSLFCNNVKDNKTSGIRRAHEAVGVAAVEMISLLLESGKIGPHVSPRCSEVDVFWRPGATLGRPIGAYLSPEGTLRADPVRLLTGR